MRVRISPMLCILALTFGFASVAQARSMELLAPNVGWIVPDEHKILWTNDGGASWRDITPTAAKEGAISGVFFLGTSRGWAMIEHGEPDVPGGLRFDLASTDNTGDSWSMRPLTVPERKYQGSDILYGESLAFVDSAHGWLALGNGLNAGHQGMGVLLVTEDGGETWKLAGDGAPQEDEPIGPILMLSPQQGWMVGGGANELLLSTHDGGRTWQTIQLAPSKPTEQMLEHQARLESFERSFHPSDRRSPRYRSDASYNLPTFKDREHGYVSVTYPGLTVLFATDNGGATWKPDRVLEGPPAGPSTVVDSTWIAARVPRRGSPRITKIAPGESAPPISPSSPENRPAMAVSFATVSEGWVLTDDHKLLSTSNGGASWTDITPRR